MVAQTKITFPKKQLLQLIQEYLAGQGRESNYGILGFLIGMPIPLQEMILGEREFLAYSWGFGVGESGNKNTQCRHSFESVVHNQHYALETLGFHYM